MLTQKRRSPFFVGFVKYVGLVDLVDRVGFSLSSLKGVISVSVVSIVALFSASSTAMAEASAPFLLVNARAYIPADLKVQYVYAPSIIYSQGAYHSYYCSTPSGGSVKGGMDFIRYSSSANLVNWTAPSLMLQPSNLDSERSACDPSVVRFNAGDGLYYYMFYSGNAKGVQTVNFVARSVSPTGPFLKYTDRGTWEQAPRDPHVITYPFYAGGEDGSGIYGAGEPSVVVRDGALYMWYTDTTASSNKKTPQVYLRTSWDGINWSNAQATNVSNYSIDVKYDRVRGLFVMFEIPHMHQKESKLIARTSKDGTNWSPPQTVGGKNCFPD